MVRLTREVRFAVNALATPIASANSYGGVPAVEGLGQWFALRITLVGSVDPKSGYLRNIVEIDKKVRELGVPIVADAVRDQNLSYTDLLTNLRRVLDNAWPECSLEVIELQLSPFLSIGSSERGMMHLSQKFEFSAAHRLHNPELSDEQNVATFGKCNNEYGHGHNYEVQVTLSGTPDSSGTLIPMRDLETIVNREAIDKLDHKHLNIQVPAFSGLNPSVENIAMTIYRMLKEHLKRENAKLASVTVWETPKTWCEYSEA